MRGWAGEIYLSYYTLDRHEMTEKHLQRLAIDVAKSLFLDVKLEWSQYGVTISYWPNLYNPYYLDWRDLHGRDRPDG